VDKKTVDGIAKRDRGGTAIDAFCKSFMLPSNSAVVLSKVVFKIHANGLI
jgi:hypothetical protein